MNDTFDPRLCASLHNEIVEYTRFAHPFPVTRNFFATYGEEAEEIPDRLTPQVIEFLENINLPTSNTGNNDEWASADVFWNFTPHLGFPTQYFWGLVGCDGEGENSHDNWIVLYPGP